MIKLKDLYEASSFPLYTPRGELMDCEFIQANGKMLVEDIGIYINDYRRKLGLKVFLYDSIYKDTDSVATP